MLVTPKNTVNKNSMKNKIFLKTKQWQSSKLKKINWTENGLPKEFEAPFRIFYQYASCLTKIR